MSSTYNQLCQNLEQLKLLQMKEHLEEVSNFVSQNKLSFSDGLLRCKRQFKHAYKKYANASILLLALWRIWIFTFFRNT